jgi:hypothetical protein
MIMQAITRNASTDWCFGQCLLLLEAFIERRIELLLTAERGNAPCAACGWSRNLQRGYPDFWDCTP